MSKNLHGDCCHGSMMQLPHFPSKLWIGTSGLVLPFTKAQFPAAYKTKSRLAFYSTVFNSIEINSSFYKTPLPATFEKWGMETASDFTFTVKLTRDITHAKKLDYDDATLAQFLMAAANLREKIGCLLIQFPASINIEYLDKVVRLLEKIGHFQLTNKWRLCVEFRHTSWYSDTTYAALKAVGASLVWHDMPKTGTWDSPITGDVLYLRFHGVSGDYRGSYNSSFLLQVAREISRHLKTGKEVYVYFNNTMGAAYTNAQTLIRACINGKQRQQ